MSPANNATTDVDFNEQFLWLTSDQMGDSFRGALERGLPFPILTVAEYFSIGQEGLSWGGQYRAAGYYATIMLWYVFVVFLFSTRPIYLRRKSRCCKFLLYTMRWSANTLVSFVSTSRTFKYIRRFTSRNHLLKKFPQFQDILCRLALNEPDGNSGATLRGSPDDGLRLPAPLHSVRISRDAAGAPAGRPFGRKHARVPSGMVLLVSADRR